MREMLVDTVAYMPPAEALNGLTPEEAERRVEGAPHSIAEIVAHMSFWMDWFCSRCDGRDDPVAASATEGWPPVPTGAWPDVQRRFLTVLERAAAIGDDRARLDAPLSPPIEFPPLATYTLHDALVHVATHNAHHLGQVIMLRRLMGRWPPPSGSYTW